MKRYQFIVASATLSAVGLLAGYGLHAYAQDAAGPEPLFYSGTISTKDGALLQGSHTVVVRLFGTETGGGAVCTTPDLKVDFDAGRFRVELPGGANGCVDAVSAGSAWTELTVDGDTIPRSRVGSVPFAVRATSASVAQSLTGEQADTLAALKNKVESLPAAQAPAGGALSYRVITTPSDCVYDAGTNSTRCTCQRGELATSGGAWAGPGNSLVASRLDFRPEDNASLADRVRVWSVSCTTAQGQASACVYVQTICLKTAI